MTDYNSLLTDVNGWLARDDLTSKIPTFIQLAEDRHANDIRVRAMTQRDRANGNGTRYLALPTNYLDMRRLWYISDTPYQLRQVAPEGLGIDTTTRNVPSRPQRYCVHEELEFNKIVETDGELEMVYWARFDRLTATNTTNWLVANAYGCYLYGALAEAAPYLDDDDRLPVWEAQYAKHTGSLVERDLRSRTGHAPQVVMSMVTP